MRRHLPSSDRRRWLVAAWIAAFVLAQTLGLLHRLAHPGPHAAAPAAAAAGATDGAALQALFGGHDADAPQCQLYDQHAHADVLAGVAALDVPAIAPSTPGAAHRGWHLAAQSAGFLARGPPARA